MLLPGEFWIDWTIRISMICYALYLLVWVWRPRRHDGQQMLRALWTGGCLAFLAHFLVAFQVAHDWSHQHALEDTARQTGELIGWEFGEGIYFSYLFLAVWITDSVWWWVTPTGYSSRPAWLSFMVHAYILFIAANGCIVFESGVTRWGGILVGLLLLSITAVRRWPRQTVPNHE